MLWAIHIVCVSNVPVAWPVADWSALHEISTSLGAAGPSAVLLTVCSADATTAP